MHSIGDVRAWIVSASQFTGSFSASLCSSRQAVVMDHSHSKDFLQSSLLDKRTTVADPLHCRLRAWQQGRSWARLICEAECLWKVDSKPVRRLGALELSQLLNEIPSSQRARVNRWLNIFSASTRFN